MSAKTATLKLYVALVTALTGLLALVAGLAHLLLAGVTAMTRFVAKAARAPQTTQAPQMAQTPRAQALPTPPAARPNLHIASPTPALGPAPAKGPYALPALDGLTPAVAGAPLGLRDLFNENFWAFKGALPVVLGQSASGQPMYADLAAMPHVLVAGATGSGKSVGLNVMLASLLFRRTPEQLRFLMIDPKVVELAPYNGIPHMLEPVVTDMDKAIEVLQRAIDEMERRYQLLAAAGAKNITSYNERASQKLPYIVIVVDEFADLLMQQGKKAEMAIARLAQKSRAAGIHLILATQRPSREVVTGLIKANFPSRIAFRVAQRVNSQIILDEKGAEHLRGNGDMLVKLNGADVAVHGQCPWISESEVEYVTGHARAQTRTQRHLHAVA